MMTKTKSKTKKPVTKQITASKPKKPTRSMPSRSGPAGQKGALGATSGF
jgi:hypothetical protein